MVIEVTYNVTDVYMSTTVSPIYITVDYSGSGGSGSSVWGSITGTLSNQTDLQTALDGKFDDPTGTTTEYIDGTGALQTFPLTLPVLQQVRNQTGATLAAGTVVYINGATGNLPTVSKAIATGDSTSAQTLGMISAAISNNGTGYVVVIGTCSGLDTSAYTEGQQLYLSGTTAGAVTTTKPYAPIHLVYIGIVTRAHPNLGTIEVRVQNGFELEELHDVDALNPSNNDGLFYNSGNELWEHKPISTVLGYIPEQPLTFSSPLSRSTNTVSIPSASSSSNGYLSSTDWSTFNGKQNALTNPVTGTGTSNELAYFSGTLAISSLTTATYPSLTELSYVKGVTSAVQTQLNAKQGTITLTTTGTSGAATLVGSTLNIPQYSGGGGMAIGGSITSATAGSVLFAGTSGVLAQNNTNFFWDDTNGRLGIGTNTPNSAGIVHVNKSQNDLSAVFITNNNTSSGAQAGFRVGLNPTNFAADYVSTSILSSNWTFGAPILNAKTGLIELNSSTTSNFVFSNRNTSGNIIFASGNFSPRMYLWGSSGNVTIQNGGTFTDAGYRLDVNGTTRIQSSLTLSAMTAGTVHFTGTGGVVSEDSSNLFWDNTNKRLGIGINTPAFTLDILGSNSTNPIFNVVNNVNAQYVPLFECNSATLSTTQTSYIAVGRNRATNNQFSFGFYYNSNGSSSNRFDLNFYGTVPRLSITAGGNVMIGTTTDAGFRLDVNGTMRVQSKMSLSAGTTSNAQINLASSTAPTSPNNGDIWFDGTDIKMRIGGVTKTFTLV